MRLVPIDTYQWRNSPGIGSAKEIAEFVWTLSTDHYDCTIDFQGLLKSAFFAYLSAAPIRIGWERDFLRKESVSRFFYTEVVKPKRIHIIDQQMELLGPLGIDPDWETVAPLTAPDSRGVGREETGRTEGFHPDQPGWKLDDQVLGSGALWRIGVTPDAGRNSGRGNVGAGRRIDGS